MTLWIYMDYQKSISRRVSTDSFPCFHAGILRCPFPTILGRVRIRSYTSAGHKLRSTGYKTPILIAHVLPHIFYFSTIMSDHRTLVLRAWRKEIDPTAAVRSVCGDSYVSISNTSHYSIKRMCADIVSPINRMGIDLYQASTGIPVSNPARSLSFTQTRKDPSCNPRTHIIAARSRLSGPMLNQLGVTDKTLLAQQI